jgi:hypothetical protein
VGYCSDDLHWPWFTWLGKQERHLSLNMGPSFLLRLLDFDIHSIHKGWGHFLWPSPPEFLKFGHLAEIRVSGLHQDHLVLVPNSFSLAPNFITFILPQTLANFVSCYNELLQKDTVSCRDFCGGVCKVGSTREMSEEPPRMNYNLDEIVLSGCFQGPHNISRQHIQTCKRQWKQFAR